MKRSTRWAVAGLVTLSLVATACGDDDDEETGSGTEATAAATTTVAGGATETTAGEEEPAAASDLDTNGDGEVVIGVATPGPRDDGAYYQALVEGVSAFAEENGFAEPVVVDNIPAAEAATQLENLARQDVDMIAVGASEIADPLPDLTEQYSEIFWFCNCGAGFPELPNLAQARDDSAEISYTAGYATGLLMQERGETKAAFIGNNNFAFEQEAFRAFELGLKAVDPSFEWQYVPTGSFNDVAAATEAFNNLLAQDVGAVYPYLGGAHEAVVQLANENDVIVMSAGASDACGRTDLDYQIAVRFDAGDYLDTIFDEILAGEFGPGDVRTFKVGVDPQPGAEICDATPEQDEGLQEAYDTVASGELTEQFTQIKTEVYSS